MAPQTYHVSQNRLCGDLAHTSVERLLDSCAKHLITGTLTIESTFGQGTIVLRAGAADEVVFAGLDGERALRAVRALGEGGYELAQRLPTLNGAIGSAAEFHADISENSIIEIMNHCESQALSCTVTIMSGFERAEICYRAGEITGVLLNGVEDEDSVVRVVQWREGKLRVTAPPLPMDICGWPSAGREPTVPFNIADIASTLPAKKRRKPGRLPYLRPSVIPPRTPAPPVPVRRPPRAGGGSLTLRAVTVGDAPAERTPELRLLMIAVALFAVWTAVLLAAGGL